MPPSATLSPPRPALLGSTTPRLWTRPFVEGPAGPCGCGCALSESTSLGFALAAFAVEIGRPLDPWQRWLGIHGLELLPDGRPRFRQVLVLVARQNGKTELLVVLTLFWMYVLCVGLVLGTSTKLDYARESWVKAVKLVKNTPALRELTPDRLIRRTNGEQEMATLDESRYKIAASNEEGGRSLTVERLVEDELRQHRDWSAHEAAENAMNAVRDAQAWAITNAGDDRSVVLNSLRAQALAFVETGDGDERLGIFEWSALDGRDVTDPAGWVEANPNLGIRVDADGLAGKARRAKEAGGEQEAKFRTEVLCQTVTTTLDTKLTAAGWATCLDRGSRFGSGRAALGVQVTSDRQTAYIAGVGPGVGGLVHAELLGEPSPHRAVARILELHASRRPPVVIDPGSHAGSMIQPLEDAGVEVIKVTLQEITAAAGALIDAVTDKTITHIGQVVLDAAVAGSTVRTTARDAWSWKGPSVAPLVAVTLALHGHLAMPDVDIMQTMW